MDLFKSRCGCGTIFTPSVRTQRVCSTCTERNHQQSRAQSPAAGYKEPKAKVYQYQAPQEVIEYKKWGSDSELQKLLEIVRVRDGYQHVGLPPRTNKIPGVPDGFQYSVDDLRRTSLVKASIRVKELRSEHELICVEVGRKYRGRRLERNTLDSFRGEVAAYWHEQLVDHEIADYQVSDFLPTEDVMRRPAWVLTVDIRDNDGVRYSFPFFVQ
jgi:hypothetical protein